MLLCSSLKCLSASVKSIDAKAGYYWHTTGCAVKPAAYQLPVHPGLQEAALARHVEGMSRVAGNVTLHPEAAGGGRCCSGS